MDDIKVMKGALRLLKRARAWFKRPQQLVRNWHYRLEDAAGEALGPEDRKDACRACAVGGLDMIVARASREYHVAEDYLVATANATGVNLCDHHTLKWVRNFYDHAIARLEREIAKAA